MFPTVWKYETFSTFFQCAESLFLTYRKPFPHRIKDLRGITAVQRCRLLARPAAGDITLRRTRFYPEGHREKAFLSLFRITSLKKEILREEERKEKMAQAIILFVAGLVLICIGGDRLVDAAVAIARKLGIPQIVVGATIVSLGTTLPEILVSTTAAFDGSAAIAAGNAFGSIICNTSLIAGLTQTLRPAKKVEFSSIAWRSAFFFVTLAAANVYGYVTGAFNHPAGIVLLLLFGLYAYLNIRRSGAEGGDGDDQQEQGQEVSLPRQFLILAVCAALLYVGANLLVDNGIFIAQAIGVPERVIAVTFIALGTSLPELVTSIMSLVKGYGNVGLGNVIGANILNLLLVIGIPSAVAGIPLERSTVTVDMPLALGVMAVLLAPILIRKKASRLQGVALLGIYAAYCVMSFV